MAENGYEMPDHSIVGNLIELLRVEANRLELRRALQDYHAADIADALDDIPEETRHLLMNVLDIQQKAEVLDEANEADVTQYAEDAPVEALAEIVNAMPADEAADILEHIDDEKAEAVMTLLDPEQAEHLRELRTYDPDSAGGIMTTEFLWVHPEETAATILERLKAEHESLETAREIFVCREDMKLKGMMRVEDILSAEAEATAASLMDTATVTVGPVADQEVCARYMQKYDLHVLPVVDLRRRMLGIITVDDILDILSDEASEDMYRLAGVGDSKPLEHGPLGRALKRLPWFLVTLVGMSLLGLIIRSFHVTIERIVAVSFFIPAIMGLGGNVGIQSATITVRGLATGEITFRDFGWLLKRELLVALIIAVVCAGGLAGVSYGVVSLGMGDGMAAAFPVGRFAMTVGVAMFVGILAAVLLGTSVPMLCDRVGVDPALASGPFVTTLIDIGTQSVYLGLATWMLLA